MFARDGSGIIRMVSDDTDEGSIRIMSQAEELGSNESRVNASIEGEETRIAFNLNFLMEILSVLDGDEVEIETMSPSSQEYLGQLQILDIFILLCLCSCNGK